MQSDLSRRLQAMHDPDQLDEWGDPIPHPVAQDALAEIDRLTAALATTADRVAELEAALREIQDEVLVHSSTEARNVYLIARAALDR